jgi:hypothetical protein
MVTAPIPTAAPKGPLLVQACQQCLILARIRSLLLLHGLAGAVNTPYGAKRHLWELLQIARSSPVLLQLPQCCALHRIACAR